MDKRLRQCDERLRQAITAMELEDAAKAEEKAMAAELAKKFGVPPIRIPPDPKTARFFDERAFRKSVITHLCRASACTHRFVDQPDSVQDIGLFVECSMCGLMNPKGSSAPSPRVGLWREQQERLERLRRGEAARRKLRALSKATAALLSLYERARHRANAPGGLQYEASKRSFEVATAAEVARAASAARQLVQLRENVLKAGEAIRQAIFDAGFSPCDEARAFDEAVKSGYIDKLLAEKRATLRRAEKALAEAGGSMAAGNLNFIKPTEKMLRQATDVPPPPPAQSGGVPVRELKRPEDQLEIQARKEAWAQGSVANRMVAVREELLRQALPKM